MLWHLLIGGISAGAIWAGFALAGFRGAVIVAFVLAMLWVSVRVVRSYDAEAELAQSNAALARAEAAFNDFRALSEKQVANAAAKIAAIEAARAQVESALAEHRQRSAAEFSALKNRIAANVPSRPQCDYPQPVLDGLRDAHVRASR
jgi:predicted acylesterase/phospholipase RssA